MKFKPSEALRMRRRYLCIFWYVLHMSYSHMGGSALFKSTYGLRPGQIPTNFDNTCPDKKSFLGSGFSRYYPGLMVADERKK